MEFILKKRRSNIPEPSLMRLCRIYSVLEELIESGESSISSKILGRIISVKPHSVRKDLGYTGEKGTSGSGYDLKKLKKRLAETLELEKSRKCCIVGLGKLGAALMDNYELLGGALTMAAGFDPDINRLETIQTGIPVYPTYEIENVVRREKIEIAVMTLKGEQARKTLGFLSSGGIRGIINFSSTPIVNEKQDIFIRNVDVMGEFRFLSALIALRAGETA